MVLQRVAGIEDILHLVDAVTLLALGDVALGEHQVVDDRLGIGPGAEQVVALEKRVVAEAGVGDDQRLHHHRIFLHQVGDAGIGIDDDFVG